MLRINTLNFNNKVNGETFWRLKNTGHNLKESLNLKKIKQK